MQTLAMRLLLVGFGLSLSACPSDPTNGDACRIDLSVRQPSPSPLGNADTLRTFVFDAGRAVHAGEVPLASTAEGTVLDVVDDETTPVLPFSSDFEAVLSTYRSGQTSVGASGRSSQFECQGEDSITVPVYLGPAMGFAATASEPEGRRNATATPLGDNRVLIYGGQTVAGSPVTPVADIYDHTSGLACAVAAGCPFGTAGPSIGHSATRLGDGQVLIIGGSIPSTGVAYEQLSPRSAVERFDPVSGTITRLPNDLSRAFHAAVLLEGLEVPAAKRGQMLVVGGLTAPVTSSDEILLVDTTTGSSQVVGTLPFPRYDVSATLIGGARVLIAGGYDDLGAAVSDVELFDVDAEQLLASPVGAPCPSTGGAATADQCAERAGHTATLLDNGNVLLWGGLTGAVPGGADPPPEAEVYVAAQGRFVPLPLPLETGELRVGHSVTPVDCFRPPCPLLIAGGEDPFVTTSSHPPYLVEPPPGVEVVDGAFNATVTPFSGTVSTTLRAYHAAAALPDGSVVLTGGIRATAEQLMLEGAVFSYCEDVAAVGGVGCPQP